MIALFIIGILFFTVELVCFAIKAAFGIVKSILFVLVFPVLLIVLFVSGLVYVAFPLLAIALICAIILRVLKGY